MRILFIFVFTAILGSAAMAAEKRRVLDGNIPIDRIDAAIAAHAGKLNITDLAVNRVSCKAQVRAVCQYNITGKVGLIASATGKNGPAEDITIMWGRDTDIMKYILSMALTMAVFDPKLPKAERGRIIQVMMSRALSVLEGEAGKDEPIVASGLAAEYKMTSSELLGIWFVVTPR